MVVGIGIAEDVCDGLACRQRLHVRLAVAERIGIRAIGIEVQRTVSAGHYRRDLRRRAIDRRTLWVSWVSTSVSLVSTLPLTGLGAVSSFTAFVSTTATGPSLTPAIFTVAVAQLSVPFPSRMA